MKDAVVIARIDAFVFRYPNVRPVSTSFGMMRDRPAVFVRLEAMDGSFGWGEIFANWPSAGAEHRANLLMQDVADLVLGVALDAPGALFHKLSRETRIRAIQCGEQGPFRQVIAGLDIALWDLFARRKNMPLRHLVNPQAASAVPAYASGIHVRDGAGEIAASRNAGYGAFKVKVGFNLEADAAAVRAITKSLQPGERLLTDANQAWNGAEAETFMRLIAASNVGWLEEPIPVDAPAGDWAHLAAVSAVPLAGGENIAGFESFDAAISDGHLAVLQPDVAKWGGITGCHEVAKRALAAGRTFCPHFLGGGIGLLASANLLAAVKGDGLLEVDVNANPLRDAIADIHAAMLNKSWHLDNRPGLGPEELPRELQRYQTLSLTQCAKMVSPPSTSRTLVTG
jgi:D-galactarolactone cycloisomerase